jgi:hypothetical protein
LFVSLGFSLIPKCSVDLPGRITILLQSTTEVSQFTIQISSSKMFALCSKVERTPRLWEGWGCEVALKWVTSCKQQLLVQSVALKGAGCTTFLVHCPYWPRWHPLPLWLFLKQDNRNLLTLHSYLWRFICNDKKLIHKYKLFNAAMFLFLISLKETHILKSLKFRYIVNGSSHTGITESRDWKNTWSQADLLKFHEHCYIFSKVNKRASCSLVLLPFQYQLEKVDSKIIHNKCYGSICKYLFHLFIIYQFSTIRYVT